MMKSLVGFLAFNLLAIGVCAQVAAKPHPIPRLIEENGRHALLVEGAPYLILGAQSMNSSDWSATLPKVWQAIDYLHANTLETPIYWEQFEPQPGHYDYRAVDRLLAQARAHHAHLVLLWFGTWKNGSQHFMPEWMKLQPEKYFHVINQKGERVDSPSPFAAASLEADKRAFAALMAHLKTADLDRAVLMVQVENETGTWGTLRDYGPQAEKLFNAPVPAEVLQAMGKPAGAANSNWKEAFGGEAEVNFHAWAIAKYVQQVAAAGKAAYALPLYTNVALRDPLPPGPPGSYESGGPTDNVIPIWKAEAPAIDILAPDDYIEDSAGYRKILDLYGRPDNALFLPETIPFRPYARWFFTVLGHQGIGYAPFGLDYTRSFSPQERFKEKPEFFLDPTAENYKLVGPMMRDLARLSFAGKLQAVAEEPGVPIDTLHFPGWDVVVSYGAARGRAPKGNPQPVGRVLVAQLKDDQFLVAGYFCTVDFRPAGNQRQRNAPGYQERNEQIPATRIDGAWRHRQFLRVEEGHYENESFHFDRLLNGDQTDYGLNFSGDPEVLRVSLATY